MTTIISSLRTTMSTTLISVALVSVLYPSCSSHSLTSYQVHAPRAQQSSSIADASSSSPVATPCFDPAHGDRTPPTSPAAIHDGSLSAARNILPAPLSPTVSDYNWSTFDRDQDSWFFYAYLKVSCNQTTHYQPSDDPTERTEGHGVLRQALRLLACQGRFPAVWCPSR